MEVPEQPAGQPDDPEDSAEEESDDEEDNVPSNCLPSISDEELDAIMQEVDEEEWEKSALFKAAKRKIILTIRN